MNFQRILTALRTPHHVLFFIIFCIFTGLTLYNSPLLPIGEAPDETDHYQYHRFVARTGHPPFTDAERSEAGFKGGLAPLYYWLTAWPVALVSEDTVPDIRRVDARPERHIPTDGLGINRLVHTLDEQWPWRGQPLAWHWVRLFSLPMSWLTLLATYLLGRRLFPQTPSVAVWSVLFMAFLPRFVISSAVINDDNLVFALTAILLFIQVKILQSHHQPRLFALFGFTFGLALLTKYFSLILIPEILFTLWIWYSQQKSNDYKPFLAFLTALLFTAGPWFIFIAIRFNRIAELGWIPGLAASLGEPQITEGLVGLFAGQSVRPPAATFSLLDWSGLLYRSFWFEYGWMQIFAPLWIYILFTIFLVLALFGLTRPTPNHNRATTAASILAWPKSVIILLALHIGLFLFVVLARYVLSATIDTGQGRHLYPALPVIAIVIGLGLHRFFSWTRQISPRALPVVGYLLLFGLFLIPSLITLLPQNYILSRYDTLPITLAAPEQFSISYQQNIAITDDFTLHGFDVPATVSAGSTLPVTLYWTVENKVNQDYLVSLCLQDEQAQPVACTASHFVDGRYPARAWEAGDTIIDTLHLPIPACFRLLIQDYRLNLELWPVHPASPQYEIETQPILTQTFPQPPISVLPTDNSRDIPQTIEFWHQSERIEDQFQIAANASITKIDYFGYKTEPTNILQSDEQIWPSHSQFTRPLYLPCDEGPTPFAQSSHFIVSPDLSSGIYRPDEQTPNIMINQRVRNLAPVTPHLNFNQTLSPLTLQLPTTEPISVTATPANGATSIPQIDHSILPITLRWQTQRWMADPLIVSLKLLDKDFAIGGERVAQLGDRYPNVLWVPTEIIEETYPVQIQPDAPAGLYQLEVSLIKQDPALPEGFEYLPAVEDEEIIGQNLYPLTLRLLDPKHSTSPSIPFEAQVGEAIQLIGYDLTTSTLLSAQTPLTFALYWQANDTITEDYTVFTQLLGPDGQVWAQWDNPPQAGRYPTTAWLTPDLVIDRYTLILRDGAPPGDYQLLVGMYNPLNGERLPTTIEGQLQPNNALHLTTISVLP